MTEHEPQGDGPAGSVAPPGGERDLFGRTPPDRPDWSHRRAEPRAFAAVWLVYLLLASGQMVLSQATLRSPSPTVMRSSASIMLAVALLGVTVVWPLFRLSQALPARSGFREALRDLAVLLPPAVALVLPQGLWFLANWSVGVLAALVCLVCVWGFLIGGLLAASMELVRRVSRGGVAGGARSALVAGFVGLSLVTLLLGPMGAPWSMLGPLSGLFELVADRSWTGTAAQVGAEHWRAMGAVAGFAAAAWLVALGLAPDAEPA